MTLALRIVNRYVKGSEATETVNPDHGERTMRIETTTRARIGGGKFWNGRLLDDDGTVLTERLWLRDVKTKRTHDARLADIQKEIDSGYRFPLMRQRLAARAEHRTSVVGVSAFR